MIQFAVIDETCARTQPGHDRYRTLHAWRAWDIHSCVEWNRGHAWVLELIVHPEDDLDRPVELSCLHCPVGIDDIFPDGHELMAGTFGDVTVQHGGHDSPVPLLIPVDVEPWSEHYNSIGYGEEWDAGVELVQRGPAVPVRFNAAGEYVLEPNPARQELATMNTRTIWNEIRFNDGDFTLTEQHLTLLRNAHVRWGDVEFGAPEIDGKRPYGNSDVLGDIAELLGMEVPKDWDAQDRWMEDNEERLVRLHVETAIALQIVLATGEFLTGTYRKTDRYHGRSWQRVEGT